jgi:hypothetical protein
VRGFGVDWTVFGVGAAALIIGLGAFAVAQALRWARIERARPANSLAPRSKVFRGANAAGLSVAGVIGVHFALAPGDGRRSVPTRSVLFGTTLAVALVVTTLTFASGLSNLVSRPALYGWNWDYLLQPTNNIPPGAVAQLNHDPKIAAWSGADYTDLEIDGREVPILIENARAKVAPPILSGHDVWKTIIRLCWERARWPSCTSTSARPLPSAWARSKTSPRSSSPPH